MKTDQPIYLYLSAGPEALRVLTGGLIVAGPYRFESLTIKGIERRLDGIIEPLDPAESAFALEFQGQPRDAVWYNLLAKMGLWGERNPRRDVQGIGVFLRRADAPAYPKRITGADSPVRAVYLDEVLRDWQAREPDNPYVLALLPLVVASEAELQAQAPDLWQRVRAAPLPEEQRATLSDVLLYWFMERFKTLTREEVRSMLNLLTSIEETSGYQAIKAEGWQEGREEGRQEGRQEGREEGRQEGEAAMLLRQAERKFGPLPESARARIAAADAETLLAWSERILTADRLEALFR